MAITKACWGIDVGQSALKAVKLRQSGGEVEAVSFDVIEHAKILSQPDADEQQLIRNALDKFLSRNDVRNDTIVISVPGQASFSRFIKLPPVELKKVPEIVKYEATQQIPFNLDEVIWGYQTMTTPTGGPAEIEVGIFAMKRDIVQDYVNDFTQVKVVPDIVQMAPVALYNYLRFDRHEGGGATLLVDVGAENTSLVIADGYRVWIRNFPLGGNNFTQALVKSFKLTFAKAENLKRHAAESKYAKEVFQAMRPVFQDLLTEIQRSIGFYTSLHRESRIERVLAMGSSFRLPGLQKFLSQNLGVEVVKVEQFNALHGDHVVNAPVFKENILSFGVAYGLALQGLGLGTITTSLLPPEILKEKEIRRKKPFVIGAAAAVALGFGVLAYGAHEKLNDLARPSNVQNLGDPRAPVGGILTRVNSFLEENNKAKQAFDTAKQDLLTKQDQVDAYMNLNTYRDLWFRVLSDVRANLPRDERLNGPNGYNPVDDAPPWNSLQTVEVLRVWGQYATASREAADKAGGGSALPTSMTTGSAAGGVPVMVVHLEGTAPKMPGDIGASIVQQRFIQRLQQIKHFQNIRISKDSAAYKYVSGYPYEKDKPVLQAPTPGAAGTASAAEIRAAEAAAEKAAKIKLLRPWRGDDYWFELQWHINLEDPDAQVVYSETTTDDGSGLLGVPTQ